MSASEWHAMQEKCDQLEYYLDTLLFLCRINNLDDYEMYKEANNFYNELNEVDDE